MIEYMNIYNTTLSFIINIYYIYDLNVVKTILFL